MFESLSVDAVRFLAFIYPLIRESPAESVCISDYMNFEGYEQALEELDHVYIHIAKDIAATIRLTDYAKIELDKIISENK